jgi:hypothetical protein
MQLRSLLVSSLFLGGVAAGYAQAPSGAPVAILELFTSEGCSSCPPADAMLRQVHLRQAASGQLIVGISEHVTYWNHLGWKDPYSAEVSTARQEAYAERLSAQGPYTPQMVLNGRAEFVGGDGAKLDRALREDAHQSHATLQMLSHSIEGGTLHLRFALSGMERKPLEIVAVITDDADQTNVARGENSGRTLMHVAVARLLTRVATVRENGEQSVQAPLPAGIAAGPGHHVVLFAQEPHQGAIVAATTVAF